jgi:hypothetical protein
VIATAALGRIGEGSFLYDAVRPWMSSRDATPERAPCVSAHSLEQSMTLGHLKAFLALKLVLLLILAISTRFVMDEFQQAGNAKIVGDGLYESIWPVKAMGAALFYKPAHWLGGTSIGTMLLARLQTAVIAIAVLALLYRVARNIGQSRWQALLTVCVCVAFSTFMERAFRTRSEPLALFFATTALWIVTSRRHELKMIVLAGVLSGLSFLATQKAVYFNFALGLALVADAAVRRRPQRALTEGAVLVLGWSAALLAYSIVLGGEQAGQVLRHLFLGPKQLALDGGDYYANMHSYIWRMLQHNILPGLICCLGLALALLRGLREDTAERRVAATFSLTITILVFNHSQPWPYVFIMIVPFLALWAPGALAAVAERMTSGWPVIVFLILAAALSLGRNVHYLGHDNRQQLRLLEQAESILLQGETYLDGIGMLAQRPDAGRAWWDRPAISALQARHAAGERDILDDLFAAQPKVVLLSYRTASLGPLLAPYVEGSYVRIAPNLMVAGTVVRPGKTTEFTARWGGNYRVYGLDGAPLSFAFTMDDAPVRDVVPVTLGPHRLALPPNTPPAVLLPADIDIAFRFPPAPDQRLFGQVYE